MKFISLVGRTYGRWVVLSFSHRDNFNMALWNCRCSCGKEDMVRGSSLQSGKSKSCGCLRIEQSVAPEFISHPAYMAYKDAKQRCGNPGDAAYENYGGRGIKFLFNSFKEFWEEMEDSYSPGLTLDRKENNGNYEPGNVRWATWTEQANNKRTSVTYTYGDTTKSQKEWAGHFQCSASSLRHHVKRLGVEEAFQKLEKENKC